MIKYIIALGKVRRAQWLSGGSRVALSHGPVVRGLICLALGLTARKREIKHAKGFRGSSD
jgi:hypothetical protein